MAALQEYAGRISPPTQSALFEGIKRTYNKDLVWGSDTILNPALPSPQGYGLELKEWSPVISQLPPSPEAVVHVIKCGCAKTRCSTNHYYCKKAELTCTDLYKYSESDDVCENSNSTEDLEDEDGDLTSSEDDDDDDDDVRFISISFEASAKAREI